MIHHTEFFLLLNSGLTTNKLQTRHSSCSIAHIPLPPLPVLALKVGVAVKLVAQTPRVERLKRRRLDVERLVQTAHERLHALARADDDAGGGAGLGLEEPAGGEGGCFIKKRCC